VILTGKPGPDNTIRIIACWTGQGAVPAPGPTLFRYVTFDAP
jgi:hypothetical protein